MLTRPRAIWLPWLLFALAVLIAAMDIVASLQNTEAASHRVSLTNWLAAFEFSLPPIAFTAVGAFVLTRRPGNRIGWLMIAIGSSFDLTNFMSDYPGQGPHGTRPLAPLAAWMSNVDWTFPWALLLVLFLLFPTGEFASRRWKLVLWMGLAACGCDSVLAALRTGLASSTSISNPTGVAAIPDDILGVIGLFGAVALLGSLLSLLVRFRSATGNVRQQLKWFTYGAALALVFDVAAFASGWSNILLGVLAPAATAAVPIFIGVAILRYRLYDIDVLVNRTLVYGSLTASLALLYIGEVILLQAIFRSLIGQQSNLGIALSTLGIAALFQPLRRRIQRTIDHRFYRRKYDAARTLVAFQDRLRDEVDLDRLTGDLLGVVQETIQPAHVSLWLRQE